MTDMHPANKPFYWATVFFRRLHELGVQQVVISPGSRSTPLTLAAAAHDHLQKHVILDERSAAFTALGIAKATGTPAVLICTSGTALANYYPAVIEARQSGVPLILATADRPPNLRATGANQAADQLKIFGDYPVFFHEVGEPHLEEQDLQRLRLLADQAIAATLERRGPAHLNFPFRKPLEPEKQFLQKTAQKNQQGTLAEVNRQRDSYPLPQSILQHISRSRRPLIMVGPVAPRDDLASIGQLADDFAIPVLAESAVPTEHQIQGFAGFLRNEDQQKFLEPDLLLRFGFQPTTKAMELALQEWHPEHHLHFATTHDWHDSTFSGAKRIPWMGRPLRYEPLSGNADRQWLPSWREAEERYDIYYQEQISQTPELTDGAIYHHLTPQITEKAFIAVSNSFPARDIQQFGRQSINVPLFLNRGVSGIDGVTSTALGLNIALEKPGILFTGDLAFLHDSNALLNQKLLKQPLVIVIINNSGGSIFRMLPVEQHEKYFDTYFETPQSVDIATLVKAHQIPFRKFENLQELKAFDLPEWIHQHRRLSVIECETNAEASMALRNELWGY